MSNADRHLYKRLRLFQSVDLVGSTAYKNRASGEVQPWLKVFYEFFRDFPILLGKKYEGSNLETPRLWKTLGDEIVFVVELKMQIDAAEHLRRFRDALRAYRDTLHQADRLLDLKGTAWVAGFPVGNSIVYLPGGGGSCEDEVEDFIGPSMDIGFRLKDVASPRRIAVSLELAHVLSKKLPEALSLYIGESVALKGVIGGRPYPVFWVNMYEPNSEELEILEDRLRESEPSPVVASYAHDFCEIFIRKNGAPFFVPFIESDPDYNDEPPDFPVQFENMAKMWGELYRNDDEPAPEGEATGNPDEIADALDGKLGKARDEKKAARKKRPKSK